MASLPKPSLAVSTDAASLAAALTAGVPLAPGFDRRQLTAVGPRKWFKVNEDGEASIVEACPQLCKLCCRALRD